MAVLPLSACDRAPETNAGAGIGTGARAQEDARRAAEQYLSAGRLDDAKTITARLVELTPDGVAVLELHARVLLAEALTTHGESRRERLDLAARAYLAAADADASNAALQHAAGTALDQAGRLDEALARYERAASLDPSNAQYPLYLGMALRRLDRLDEAIGALDRARALEPDAAPILVARADALLALGRAEAALADSRRARTLDRADPGARIVEARSLRALGRSLEAAELLSALDERMRSNEALAQELAGALLEIDRPADAASAWEASLVADPRRWLSALGAAEAWLAAGDLIRARARLELAFELAPAGARESRVRELDERLRAAAAALDQRSDRPPSTIR